jgi:hypothetical protein
MDVPPVAEKGAVLKTNLDPVQRWQALSERGLLVSICCGQVAGLPPFSVQVMTLTGESFDCPYAANSLDQAVDIAETEATKRGWFRTGGVA